MFQFLCFFKSKYDKESLYGMNYHENQASLIKFKFFQKTGEDFTKRLYTKWWLNWSIRYLKVQ